MSATFTEPVAPSAETLTLPSELWRAFADERRMGSKAREATSHAFQRCPQFTKSDTRERLAKLMIEREAAHGLHASPAEYEAELLAEAERVAADGVPHEPGSAAAVEADAHRRAGELRAAIEDMAPEALTDAKVAARQRTAESELADVEHTLANLSRAPRVIAQREQSAAEQAEREAREQADLQAQEMLPLIATARSDVDRAALAWVTAVEGLQAVTEQRVEYVARATGGDNMAVRGARFRDWEVLSALRAATRGHHLRIDELATGPRDTLLVPAEPGGE
jgi:hypothetical protein